MIFTGWLVFASGSAQASRKPSLEFPASWEEQIGWLVGGKVFHEFLGDFWECFFRHVFS